MTARTAAPPPSRVESRALAKGLLLLDVLSAAPDALSLADLARSIDLGKASTFRLLQTLVAGGRVAADGEGNYRIARPVASAPPQVFERLLRECARPELETLSAETGETVSLAVLREDHVRVLDSLESPHHIRLSNPVDRIVPPYASSLGKAIMAWQPPQRQAQMIAVYGIYQITAATITDPAAIRREMARVRERGFAQEREESVPGGCCYGAPVFSDGTTVKAAVSIAMPLVRYTSDSQKRFPAMLRTTARRISARLGGKVPAAA